MNAGYILTFTTNLRETTRMHLLRFPLHDVESNAHTFRVRVQRDGEDVDLSGYAVIGYFIRASGTTMLTGRIDGTYAEVALTSECYTPCVFDLLLTLSEDEGTACALWVHGSVRGSMIDTDYDPDSSTSPDITELSAKVAEVEQIAVQTSVSLDALTVRVDQNGDLIYDLFDRFDQLFEVFSTLLERVNKKLDSNLGPTNAGKLLYISADGSIQPLTLGTGLKLENGALNVIGGTDGSGGGDTSQLFYTADGSVFQTLDDALLYVAGG